jgi:hypothetical protein
LTKFISASLNQAGSAFCCELPRVENDLSMLSPVNSSYTPTPSANVIMFS